jgi:hypothetical protein
LTLRLRTAIKTDFVTKIIIPYHFFITIRIWIVKYDFRRTYTIDNSVDVSFKKLNATGLETRKGDG